MCVFVCGGVYACIWCVVCACMCSHMYVCLCMCSCVCVHVYVHVFIPVCVWICICVYVYMCICVYEFNIYICVCVCVCVFVSDSSSYTYSCICVCDSTGPLLTRVFFCPLSPVSSIVLQLLSDSTRVHAILRDSRAQDITTLERFVLSVFLSPHARVNVATLHSVGSVSLVLSVCTLQVFVANMCMYVYVCVCVCVCVCYSFLRLLNMVMARGSGKVDLQAVDVLRLCIRVVIPHAAVSDSAHPTV
jgi:hypothetical protein